MGSSTRQRRCRLRSSKRWSKDAQTYLGEEVRDVVITVPAYFGDKERAATQEAGEIAGLNVLALLPEPHAAALAFAVDKAAEIMDRLPSGL